MQILVFSKEQCRKNRQNILHHRIPTICIMNMDDRHPVFAEDDSDMLGHNSHILNVHFDDVIEDDPVSTGFMTVENAVEILKFVEDFKNKDIMIVHCFAGMCRSGAVGQFINELVNADNEFDKQYFETNNKQIIPNPFVLKMLKMAHEKFEWDI